MTFYYILAATFSITLCVFVAVGLLYTKKEILSKILLSLVSLSAGALMGGAFIHLIPEALEDIEAVYVGLIVLLAFIIFLLLEKFFHWRHCHDQDCDVHNVGRLNLIGDTIHNFIDGVVISASFLVDINIGIATTLAIALHEIPQEIGDFGVLLYAGYDKRRALIFNYIVASTVILGGITGYYFSYWIQGILPYMLPFAAGGFLYIAASDLIPEIRKEEDVKKSVISIIIFISGIVFMFLAKFID